MYTSAAVDCNSYKSCDVQHQGQSRENGYGVMTGCGEQGRVMKILAPGIPRYRTPQEEQFGWRKIIEF